MERQKQLNPFSIIFLKSPIASPAFPVSVIQSCYNMQHGANKNAAHVKTNGLTLLLAGHAIAKQC